jgi:hypothetical protein
MEVRAKPFLNFAERDRVTILYGDKEIFKVPSQNASFLSADIWAKSTQLFKPCRETASGDHGKEEVKPRC